MSVNNKPSVLIVGCGLIGTSLALAWRKADAASKIDGLDIDEGHRLSAIAMGAFAQTWSTWPNCHYDVVVLATPVDTACAHLVVAAEVGTVVMDVCSVKQPICNVAMEAGLGARYAPTHPMSGLASGGPLFARADLFVDRPFIVLQNFPSVTSVLPLIVATGARLEWLPSATVHDQAMASVSHVVHLASLAVMNAYQNASNAHSAHWHRLTGPGFRDVTRLSASPSDFWVSTLQANAAAVVPQIDRVIDSLCAFRSALAADDTVALRAQLDKARHSFEAWREEQP